MIVLKRGFRNTHFFLFYLLLLLLLHLDLVNSFSIGVAFMNTGTNTNAGTGTRIVSGTIMFKLPPQNSPNFYMNANPVLSTMNGDGNDYGDGDAMPVSDPASKTSPMAMNTSTATTTSAAETAATSSKMRPAVAHTSAAPMYITVGPQCCGKTTYLRNNLKMKYPSQYPPIRQQKQTQTQTQHSNPSIPMDISLDDQPDVYVPIDTNIFLHIATCSTTLDKSSLPDDLWTTNYHGRTLVDRIQQDNTELSLILQRWNGSLSPQNFAIDLIRYYQQQDYSLEVAHTLIHVIEKIYAKQQQQQQQKSFLNTTTNKASSLSAAAALLPSQVQLFILESLFRPHPTTQQSAIQRAHSLLRKTPSHIPIAWGNTNTKPRDYQMALEIACQTRRPVHFLVSGVTEGLENPPLSTLLERNVQRLFSSGKYIPAASIADCQQRVYDLLSAATATLDDDEDIVMINSHNTTNANANTTIDMIRMQQNLVWMAKPRSQNRNGPPPYRYRLTKHSLVQKQYGENNEYSKNGNGKQFISDMGNIGKGNGPQQQQRQQRRQLQPRYQPQLRQDGGNASKRRKTG